MAVEPRRLLIVSHGYPPYFGGAEHAAGLLARAAQRSGRWLVEVVTSDIGGRLPAREVMDDIVVQRVPTRKKAWQQHSVPELMSFILAAGDVEPVNPPDLILANFTLPGGEVGRKLSAKTGAPYFVILQGSDVPDYQNERFGMIYPFARPWIKAIWRRAAGVIAVSDSLRALALHSWPEGSVEVIHNGVDVERFRPPESCSSGGNVMRVLINAQLIERKGIHHLLAACAALTPDRRQRLRLEVCGTGPMEQELKRMVEAAGLSRQVHFAGLVAYEHIPARLRAADVFALPSRQEGMPLALLEAMASGLPVLASPVGAIPDVVEDGVHGFLVQHGDRPGLAHALTRFIDEPELCRPMGIAAREAAERWSWDHIWAQYEALANRQAAHR